MMLPQQCLCLQCVHVCVQWYLFLAGRSLASTTHNVRTFSSLLLLSLLGWTALRRFSIHLSLSAAERHEKHFEPVDVVT